MMARPAIVSTGDRALEAVRQVAIVIAASFFVALCARVTLPLPFTPVPLTLQNFGVLLVGLMLGSRRAFAALALYLAEGMMGLSVFNPTGLGGLAGGGFSGAPASRSRFVLDLLREWLYDSLTESLSHGARLLLSATDGLLPRREWAR